MRRLLLHYNVVIPRDRQRARDVSAALCSTKFKNAKTNGLATVAAGANYFARVSGKLADARHRCRRSTGHNAGTRWYSLRRRIGRTRYLWSLRDHRPTSGLCTVRSQSHLGSWTRFCASGDHTWRCFSAIRRQRSSRRSSAFGTKRTSESTQPMSAFGGKGDVTQTMRLLLGVILLAHWRVRLLAKCNAIECVRCKWSDTLA
jgi:hypothetical protein